ncbi:response regulator [Thiohalomonas denitrificans]|uniref:Two component transcriptional regulator, LuxR family n=1 Tax=Thiohalomonas denitrificans TaxID=415747 RepID=A0A1G5QE06_9GAMM|nr:response regulator [Thiohalomonas denitrificans]SCZ59826.1 two component transcriptional regulator, LuxR family [Thiohalomonas denitrificans]
MRVLLIDDHTLFRSGLETLLERHGIDVAAAVGDGREGLEKAKELQPEIILLDMRMPDMNGLEVLNALRREGLTMPIVMLTTSNEEEDLVECLRNGAQGYLLKDMEPTELVEALREIVGGKTIVAPELAGVLARVVQGDGGLTVEAPKTEANPFDELTPREKEILCLLAEGQSNKVIARNLGISDGTVKLHVKAILRKLDVHSRVEAAVMAVEQSLCPKE